MDVAFVTGASGFVGTAVARRLARAGHKVRALVRRSSNRRNLDVEGLEAIEGDMRDCDALARGMDGARWVLHVAADYRLWARRPDEILHTNVEGTRAVLLAAKRAGVERIVYTSSVATLKLPCDGTLADESTGLEVNEAIGAYKRSKVAAEKLALACAREGLPVVIVNPSTPVGPRDLRPTPTGRMIVEAAAGRMPAYVDTGLNIVHVEDVAEGHMLALCRGRIGERYILGGENLTLAEILALIAGLVGRPPPRLQLPRAALLPLAYAAEGIAHMTGREPFITVDGLRMAKQRMFFSSGKAARELGYTARPAARALADAVAWFRQAGMIA
jgi:dihydroflavonol-4-reductase